MEEGELLNLIKIMSDDSMHSNREGEYSNEGSPSWFAFRKVEQLVDVSIVPFLVSLVEKSKDIVIRKNIYFIIGKIGTNTGDRRVADILLKRLDTESKKYLLLEILSRIAEQRNVNDCSSIINFIDDKRSLVRHTAIDALRSCESCLAEDTLIKIISNSTDEYDLLYANSVLSEIGTDKAISPLINLLDHPKADVKCTALWALNELGNTSLLPVFLKALDDRSPAVKGYAMLAIHRHGNESAINSVIKRIRNILKRKRSVDSDELLLAFEFLIRYKDSYKEINNLLEWIISNKLDFLFGKEEKWVNKNVNPSN